MFRLEISYHWRTVLKDCIVYYLHFISGFFERDPFGPFFQTSQGDHHYNENFVELIQEFSAIIVAQIYGHTHTDSFRIFCNNPDCQTGEKNQLFKAHPHMKLVKMLSSLKLIAYTYVHLLA